MAKPDFSSFTKEALLAILGALGVSFPGQDTMQVSELAQMVSDTEVAVGEKAFAEAIAQAQGYAVQPLSSGTSSGSRVQHRSITPGSSTQYTEILGVGSVGSVTWDPPTPLEYGRTFS